MSKSRPPSFSKADKRGMLAEDLGRAVVGEGLAKPMRRATSAMIHQSGRASPGSGRNARWREMRRSELVTVPSFSPQAAAGSSTCGVADVSVSATHVGDDDERAGLERRAHAIGVGHANRPGWSP